MTTMPPTEITALAHAPERVRYFPRQLITAQDMLDEQRFWLDKLRRHNRLLHGWGVVCGCDVTPAPESGHPWRVQIGCGYVITPCGDEIQLDCTVKFDFGGDGAPDGPCAPPPPPRVPAPVPPPAPAGRNIIVTAFTAPATPTVEPVYLAVRYASLDARPVRSHATGCGCDELGCEYTRVRDGFELAVLPELPLSHKLGSKIDDWVTKFHARGRGPIPTPTCPPMPPDNWVVLATVRLPVDPKQPIDIGSISYADRLVLLSTALLQRLAIETR
jgi:hypothetical protein